MLNVIKGQLESPVPVSMGREKEYEKDTSVLLALCQARAKSTGAVGTKSTMLVADADQVPLPA